MNNKHKHFCKNISNQSKTLVIHLIDDFHVMNIPTRSNDKANVAIHMASSLPAIAIAYPVDGAMILFKQE